MAKKEAKVSIKSLINQFMQRSLQSLVSVVAQNADHLVEWVRNLPSLKEKIKRLLTAIILLSAGLAVFGIGISMYIASLFPELEDGLSYILIGLLLIIVAIVYIKLKE
jgi:ABC-type transporter Mla subunit MlaD|tara:strand:+ start:138 stop:461 length:324 start_codon:yes stop_codon:yes gene_type:complete